MNTDEGQFYSNWLSAGLIVKAELDPHRYDTAVKVSDQQLANLKLLPHSFHGDWNYTITPRK